MTFADWVVIKVMPRVGPWITVIGVGSAIFFAIHGVPR